MSSAIVSGGFPHLYRTDVSGAPIDASAVRSVARADVAELHAEITPSVDEEPEHHLVNIAAKRALTVTEFKQMFYARGDDKFSLANIYECANGTMSKPNTLNATGGGGGSNILASVWGKRITTRITGSQHTRTYHELELSGVSPINGESIVIYDAWGKGVRFTWKDTGTNGELLDQERFTDNGYQPANFAVVWTTPSPTWTIANDARQVRDHLCNAINRAAGFHGKVGAYVMTTPYAQADVVGVGSWHMSCTPMGADTGDDAASKADSARVRVYSQTPSSNGVQRVDITDQPGGLVRALGTSDEQRSIGGVMRGTHAGFVGNHGSGWAGSSGLTTPQGVKDRQVTYYGRQAPPYNTSRVMNYNKLGGRPDDPHGVDLAYGYATDLQRNFYAQFEVMGNIERDLCLKRDCWTICSRMSIEDQLYSLCFVAEDSNDVCMKVTCARKWSEVEDALAESCLAENNTIGWGDYVDLYINVRVSNASPKVKDTILRIRFPVQITRGPDDLGNWNVVASDAADAVITTGVGYDAPEGGNLQYRNAAQTEIHPDYMNQQQTQRWDSTRPHNTNQKVDPHDVVGNP